MQVPRRSGVSPATAGLGRWRFVAPTEMSTVKTPKEKKRLSYKKDHVVDGGENDKSFRKNWPRKKARLNRAHRRKVAQVFVVPTTVDADEADSASKTIKRPKARKWGVLSLGEAVANHQESRVRNYGARKARRGKPPINVLAIFNETANA